MSRYDHVVRVVRFLEQLEDSKAGVTLRAATEELGVSERTARRYIEALRRNGYDVEDGAGRYRLQRQPGKLQRLSEADRRAMVMAVIAARPLQGTPLCPRPADLNEQLFPSPRQRELFAHLQMPLSAPHRLAIDYLCHEATLRALLKAIGDRQVVHATYFTAGRNEWTERDLDPYTFYYDPTLESLYVFAYCHLRGEMRTFAAHRFGEVRITRNVFRPDPAFSIEKYLAGAFRVYRGKQTAEVVLHFSAAVARRVAEHTWHASQRTRTLPDGALEMTLTVDGDDELRPFILSHGADVRVVAPDWLAEKIADEAERIAGSYRERRLADAPRAPPKRARPKVTFDRTG